MFKKIFFFILIMAPIMVFAQVEWMNPSILSKNNEKPHATFIPYSTVEGAYKNDYSNSPLFKSLNGKWLFSLCKNPNERPKEFWQNNYNTSGWKKIPVPSNWELQGYDYPIYVNIPYEFTKNPVPPFVPEDYNPVGLYKTKFSIPGNWKDKRVFIHFRDVKSYMNVWLNGEFVGMNKGSKMPAEFDITDKIEKGNNDLSVEVFRFSDASYLECQDFWRISGIEGDVYIYATDEIRIKDFFADAGLENNYKDGILKLTVDIKNYGKEKIGYNLEYKILDKSGKVIVSDINSHSISEASDKQITFNKKIEDVKKWSAETPHLYSLILILKDPKNNIIEDL